MAAALERIAELEGQVAALQLQVQTLEQALAAANVQVADLKVSITEHESPNTQVLLHWCQCGMPSSDDAM